MCVAFLLGISLLLTLPALAAGIDPELGIHDIVTPEPGTASSRQPNQRKSLKKKLQEKKRARALKVRRGSSVMVYPTPLPPPLHYVPPGSHSLVARPPTVPPPIYVPQTGRLLPNLPLGVGSGPNGTETYQDRATRCVHQAGVYGTAAGNRAAYIGSCINQ